MRKIPHQFMRKRQKKGVAVLLLLLILPLVQADGAPNSPSRHALFAGEYQPSKNLQGVHPRLFFTAQDIITAADEYKRSPKSFIGAVPSFNSPAMNIPFPPMTQGETAIQTSRQMAKIVMAYVLTKDQRYLSKMMGWIPDFENYEPLTFDRLGQVGNHDLVAGTVLLNLALAYDTVKGRSNPKFEAALYHALTAQAQATYENLSGLKSFPYEQNHLTIPSAGLAIASMALVDENPDAKRWAVFSINILRRGLDALAPDGWFFESISYWNFTMQYLVAASAALKQTTGEDLFAKPPLNAVPTYLAHITLPNPNFVFDFSDWGPRVQADGISAQKGWDSPWHTLKSHVDVLTPSLVQWYHPTPLLENYLNWVGPLSPSSASDNLLYMRRRISFPPVSQPMKNGPADPPYHYFNDMEVVHWRSSWEDPNATAIAFKSGPPAGHHMADLLPDYPEWTPSLGHAHPDAGTFTLFAKGVFLANGDNGYGRKHSANSNTILVDGIGQGLGGVPWDCFAHRPYVDWDKTRLENVWIGSTVAAATAVFDAPYDPSLQIKTMRRDLILVDGRYLVIRDRIASDLPHQYEWRLHGDRKQTSPRANRFVMENGPGRLVVESLLPTASFKIEPTILDTELYDAKRSRPVNRGFHIALESPKDQKDFQFLTAMLVQSSSESADTFTARQEKDGRIELSDGTTRCTIWLEGNPALRGSFAYVVRGKDGKIDTAGLAGQSLVGDKDLPFPAKPSGPSVIFHAKDSGAWTTEQ